jgi:hypothetical protein
MKRNKKMASACLVENAQAVSHQATMLMHTLLLLDNATVAQYGAERVALLIAYLNGAARAAQQDKGLVPYGFSNSDDVLLDSQAVQERLRLDAPELHISILHKCKMGARSELVACFH